MTDLILLGMNDTDTNLWRDVLDVLPSTLNLNPKVLYWFQVRSGDMLGRVMVFDELVLRLGVSFSFSMWIYKLSFVVPSINVIFPASFTLMQSQINTPPTLCSHCYSFGQEHLKYPVPHQIKSFFFFFFGSSNQRMCYHEASFHVFSQNLILQFCAVLRAMICFMQCASHCLISDCL